MAYRPKLRPLVAALSRIQSAGGILPLSMALTGMTLAPQYASAQQSSTQSSPQASGITMLAAEGGASEYPAPTQTMPEVQVQGQADNDFAPGKSTVGAKVPTEIRDIPQSVTVITKPLMNSVGATSLTDALQYVPGITIQSAEGGTIGNNINLDGFSAREDMFIDGFRDRGQYYRDTFDLEQVEVLMGSSSMLFGRGSTAGVINQVSKQANLQKATEVTGSVTSNGAVRSTFDINTPLSGTSSIRVNGFGQDWDTTRDVMSYKDFGLAPNLKFGIGTPTEITLSALLQHNADMPDYGIPVAFAGTVSKPTFPAPITNKNAFYGATDDNTAQDITFLNGEIKHAFSPDVNLRSSIQYNHYIVDVRETAGNAVGTVSAKGVFAQLTSADYLTTPLSDMYVRLQSHDRNIIDSSLYNQTDLDFTFNTGYLHHTLLAGTEIGRDDYSNQALTVNGGSCDGGTTAGIGGTGFVACTSLLNPAYLPRPAGVTDTNGNLVTASADTVAAYVNDTVAFGKYFKVVAGVRQDNYQAEETNTITSATLLPYYSQSVNFTSVRGGVIFQPTQTQSYYVSYSTSFDPALEALTVTNGEQNTPPETNKAYEVGSKFDLFNENLSLTAALYRIDQDNTLNQIDTGVYENEGNTQTQGIRLGTAGHLTSAWQIYAGYLVMNSKVISGPPTIATGGVITAAATTGNELANTPRETFTLWTTYDLTPIWQIGGGVISMSSRYATTAQLAEVPGFAEFNAAVTYHPSKKYDIQLNLYNLTDKFYYINTAGGDGGRSVPGEGPTAMLTGRYRF